MVIVDIIANAGSFNRASASSISSVVTSPEPTRVVLTFAIDRPRCAHRGDPPHHQNSSERLNVNQGLLADIFEETSAIFGLRSRQPLHRPNPRSYHLADSLGRAGVEGRHEVRFFNEQPPERAQGNDHSCKSVSPCRKPVSSAER